MSTNDIVASIDADVVLDKKWLETIIKYFEMNSIIMCGGKMTEKYLDSKINEWRSIYYSQNWGNNDIENPPFYTVAIQFNIRTFGKILMDIMRNYSLTEKT